MADKIRIDDSEVSAIVGRLKESSKELNSYKEKLKSILQNINEAWQGADATQYTKNMQDNYEVLFEGFIEVLNSFIEYLDKVPDVYNEFDETQAGNGVSF